MIPWSDSGHSHSIIDGTDKALPHKLRNVITREEGVPQAVLLRALEPVEGIDDKIFGPGLLCRAMHIDRTLNGVDLRGRRLWIERPHEPERRGRSTRATRIGVDYSGKWAQRLWRFFAADSPYVSTMSGAARTRALNCSDRYPL